MLSPLGQCEFVSEHLNLIRNVNIVAGCDIIIVTVVIGDMTLAAIYVLFSTSLSMDSRQQTEWTKNTWLLESAPMETSIIFTGFGFPAAAMGIFDRLAPKQNFWLETEKELDLRPA